MLPDGFAGLREAANADEQFRVESRGMEGAVLLDIADESVLVEVGDGQIRAVRPSFRFSSSDVRLRSIWINHGCSVEGDQVLALRYWGAMRRLVQLAAEGWDDD